MEILGCKRKEWQNKFDRSYMAQSESTIDHVISLTHSLLYTPYTRLHYGEKLAKNWVKRHKTSASEARRAVDWGGGKGSAHSPIFFLLFYFFHLLFQLRSLVPGYSLFWICPRSRDSLKNSTI